MKRKIQKFAVTALAMSFWSSCWAAESGNGKPEESTRDDGNAVLLDDGGHNADWNKAVRGFRREHNFALTVGAVHSQWHLSPQLLPGEQQSESSKGYYGYFSYTFHLPIYRGIGYYLGSGVGATLKDEFDRDAINTEYCYSLPGVIFGLTANLSSSLRLNGALSGNLERIDSFTYNHIPDSFGDRNSMSITMRVWALSVSLDLFFKLPWAFRIEGEFRRLSFQPPKGVTSDSILAYQVGKDEKRLGLGLVYHLI